MGNLLLPERDRISYQEVANWLIAKGYLAGEGMFWTEESLTALILSLLRDADFLEDLKDDPNFIDLIKEILLGLLDDPDVLAALETIINNYGGGSGGGGASEMSGDVRGKTNRNIIERLQGRFIEPLPPIIGINDDFDNGLDTDRWQFNGQPLIQDVAMTVSDGKLHLHAENSSTTGNNDVVFKSALEFNGSNQLLETWIDNIRANPAIFAANVGIAPDTSLAAGTYTGLGSHLKYYPNIQIAGVNEPMQVQHASGTANNSSAWVENPKGADLHLFRLRTDGNKLYGYVGGERFGWNLIGEVTMPDDLANYRFFIWIQLNPGATLDLDISYISSSVGDTANLPDGASLKWSTSKKMFVFEV